MIMTSSRPKQIDAIQLVSKGWGYEKWIVNCEEYCGKILHMVKGKRCSWHMHKIKDEVFYVQSGKIKIYYGWDDMLDMASVATLERGDKFHVPTGMRHQMIALEDTELFEFSTQHFEEDSYRLIKGD
jgi:mannose-6-phosphate isomerase-like protein (cupin superfamily)